MEKIEEKIIKLIEAASSLTSSQNSATGYYFQPNKYFLRRQMIPPVMCGFLWYVALNKSFQPEMLESYIPGCAAVLIKDIMYNIFKL
jgi:hypothetical protein